MIADSVTVTIYTDIQLFQERLSYKRIIVNTTMSKVIMSNNGFALD